MNKDNRINWLQFDKDDVEAVGLVSLTLGLRTLTIIDWAVRD